MQKLSTVGKFHVEPPFTSLDHLVGAQTRTFLIRLLLAVVPDIGCELPVASDLLTHHEIFAGPSGLTSRVISFGSLTCSAMLFHSSSIAALPFTMPEPGGNAVASSE